MSVVGNELTCAGNRSIGTDRDGIGPELRSLRCSRRVHGRDCRGPEQYPDASTSARFRFVSAKSGEEELMHTKINFCLQKPLCIAIPGRIPTQRSAGGPRL